jgi:hypothetical protein
MIEFPEKSLTVEHLSEPLLVFGHGQHSAHPKDGLFLYGPHEKARKAQEVRLGLIGTAKGIGHFRTFAKKIAGKVTVPPPGRTEKKDRLHLANFPGLEATFGITFEPESCVGYAIEEREIDRLTRIINLHEAVSKTVKLYSEKARRHKKNDEREVDVWILILPEIISDRCRPGAKRTALPMEKGDFSKKQKKRSDLPLLAPILEESGEEIFDDTPDFHRLAKAEFLSIGPTHSRNNFSARSFHKLSRLSKPSHPRRSHGCVEPCHRSLLQDPTSTTVETC